MSSHPLEGIFHPQSIAIVGATSQSVGMGSFLASLIEHRFKGAIYPVNPKHSEILGMKAYPSVRDIPGTFDFVISAAPANMVLQMLEDCSEKGAKYAVIFTARFSETGREEGKELEKTILRKAKELNIRLIGPNCMGVYHPREGISWEVDFPKESGPIGFVSQSGGLSIDIIRTAAMRGVRFSKVISYGNAIDLNESDYLDYLSQDEETKTIIMYVEGVKDGKRFYPTLRRAAEAKPIIILKGGRGKAGARAATSHTASLVGSTQIWNTAITQAGAISADNLDELIDLAVSFCFLPSIGSSRVGVATAGGGGSSVLAADICEQAGLDVIPLPQEIREELKAMDIAVWDWISNPADFSISYGVNLRPENLLQLIAQNQNFDFIISSIGGPRQRSGDEPISIDKYLEPYKLISRTLKPILALVPDKSRDVNCLSNGSWKKTCDVAAELVAAKIPFYSTLDRAARAVAKLIDYYQRRG